MRDAREQPTLSIVVPAYDEERRLPRLLDALAREADEAAAAAGARLVEVVIVDDGSTDGTRALAEAWGGLEGRLRVLATPTHRGKGAAVRAGSAHAVGDWALVTDVDLSAPLAELHALAEAMRHGADLAMGSRAVSGSRLGMRQPWYRERLGKTFNLALRLLTGLPHRDTQCGFKLLRLETMRQVVESCRVDGFAFDAELCVRATRAGLPVEEVPVAWSNDPDTHVGLVRGSVPMAFDLLRIAWWSRSLQRRSARK